MKNEYCLRGLEEVAAGILKAVNLLTGQDIAKVTHVNVVFILTMVCRRQHITHSMTLSTSIIIVTYL
jgi:hypothetical protein